MKRSFLTLFMLVALLSLNASLLAQGAAQVSIQADRMEFRAAGDEMRNLVMLVSKGQLQTTQLLTTEFRLNSGLLLDSIQDAPTFNLSVNIPSLTTGFAQLDASVLSEKFINFGDAETLEFKLLSFATGRVFRMENEKRIEAAGQGELTLGDMTDTVRVEMGIRYLAGNQITAERMAGNLVHFDGTIYFRLSSFGIEVPKENRLLVNDQIELKFDIFASTEFQLPAMSTTSMEQGSMTEDMATEEGQ